MEIELTKEMLLYGKEVAKQEREHERKRILKEIDGIFPESEPLRMSPYWDRIQELKARIDGGESG